MPDDHSELVPLLPIPNRTVKRLSADDSAGSRVKVGHCQAIKSGKRPAEMLGVLLCARENALRKKAPPEMAGLCLLANLASRNLRSWRSKKRCRSSCDRF